MHNFFKSLFFVFIATSLFTLNSCDNDSPKDGESSPVNIVFKAVYDGEPLVMNERYLFNNTEISFSKLQFYISDLALKEGEMEIVVEEIDFVDFTTNNIDATAAAEGITISSSSVPTATYNGISFGIGVPSDSNEQLPSDYSSSHPLGLNSEYWSAWDSYIFSKIEGRFDEDGDMNQLESSLLYHIGTDDMFRVKNIPDLLIDVKEGNTTTITFEIEVMDLLKDGSSYIDLSTEGFTHTNPENPAELSLSNKIADNWINSIIKK